MSQSGMSQEDLRRIAEAIASKLAGAIPLSTAPQAAGAPRSPVNPGSSVGASGSHTANPGVSLGDGIFTTIDDAVKAARAAFVALSAIGLEQRKAIIESMRKAMRASAEPLARMAQEESGLGRTEDKIVKNLLVTNKTPGPEDLAPDRKSVV